MKKQKQSLVSCSISDQMITLKSLIEVRSHIIFNNENWTRRIFIKKVLKSTIFFHDRVIYEDGQ
jgi:hypothetical protein